VKVVEGKRRLGEGSKGKGRWELASRDSTEFLEELSCSYATQGTRERLRTTRKLFPSDGERWNGVGGEEEMEKRGNLDGDDENYTRTTQNDNECDSRGRSEWNVQVARSCKEKSARDDAEQRKEKNAPDNGGKARAPSRLNVREESQGDSET
jgi:hypothetical protein